MSAEARASVGGTLLAALLGLGLSIFEASDADLGFHLATGRAILASGSIPTTNVLSYTQPDHVWALHQWLPALLFELAWQALGAAGPTLLKACVIAATLALSARTAMRLGASPAASLLAVALGAWAASYRYVERPLIFSGLCLAATLLALAEAREAEGVRQRAWLVLATGMATLAWHLHAGALFIVIALVVVAIGCAADGALRRAMPEAGTKPALAVLGVAGLSLLLALGSLALYREDPIGLVSFPLQMAGDPFLHEHLVEFRPPHVLPAIFTAPLFVALAVLALVVVARVRKLPLAAIGLAALGAAMALRHARLVDSFALLAVPALALGLRDLPERAEKALPAALAVVLVAAPVQQLSRYPIGLGLNPDIWPTAFVDVIARDHLRGPIFASDGWAGPLLGLLYPGERAFFDPRFEAYSRQHWRDAYLRTRDGEPGWDTTLDRWDVELVLLAHTSAGEARRQEGAPNLRQHLARDERWALLAFDDRGSLFVRAAGVNRDAAERDAIVGVDPDRGSFVGPRRAASLRSLGAAWERGPRSATLAAMAGLALADAGHPDEALALLSEANVAFPDQPLLAEAARRVARIRSASVSPRPP